MSRLIDEEVVKRRMHETMDYQDLYLPVHFEMCMKDAPTIELPQWVSVKEELPKSGTHVLVCCEIHGVGGYKSRYVCDGFHTDAKSIPCKYCDDIDSEYDDDTDEYYFPVGWWEVIKNWDDYSCVAISDFVTHWMPLPEPPMGVQE